MCPRRVPLMSVGTVNIMLGHIEQSNSHFSRVLSLNNTWIRSEGDDLWHQGSYSKSQPALTRVTGSPGTLLLFLSTNLLDGGKSLFILLFFWNPARGDAVNTDIENEEVKVLNWFLVFWLYYVCVSMILLFHWPLSLFCLSCLSSPSWRASTHQGSWTDTSCGRRLWSWHRKTAGLP